jgi:hypothetical protein
MQVTPIHWWSPEQRDAMAVAVAPAWGEWLRQWLPAGSRRIARCACRLAWELGGDAAAHWTSLGRSSSGAAWIRWVDEREGAHYAMFGCSAGAAPVSRALARDAAADAERRLREAMGLDDVTAPPPAPFLFRAWSGAVVVTLAADDLALIELLVDSATASALLPPALRVPSAPPIGLRSKLIPVEHACAPQPLKAEIRLACCELDLGTLASLRVGDIIPLAHSLESALDVVVEGQVLCAGYLGRRGNSKAIELARPTPKD